MNINLESLKQWFTGQPQQAAPAPAPTEYKRPEIDEATQEAIARAVNRQINGKPFREVRKAFMAVCIENARLLAEVNEHRAARGLAPLPVYEPR